MMRKGLNLLSLMALLGLTVLACAQPKKEKSKMPYNPPEFTVENHLKEQRVIDFFNGSKWKTSSNSANNHTFISPSQFKADGGSTYNFALKEVHLDEPTGHLYWLVEYRQAPSTGDFAKTIYYFPEATATAMGDHFYWHAQLDKQGHIIPGKGDKMIKQP